jgi:hypothetical protein
MAVVEQSLPGVSFYPRTAKWAARVNVDGRRKHLGYFETQEEAHRAYLAAKASKASAPRSEAKGARPGAAVVVKPSYVLRLHSEEREGELDVVPWKHVVALFGEALTIADVGKGPEFMNPFREAETGAIIEASNVLRVDVRTVAEVAFALRLWDVPEEERTAQLVEAVGLLRREGLMDLNKVEAVCDRARAGKPGLEGFSLAAAELSLGDVV